MRRYKQVSFFFALVTEYNMIHDKTSTRTCTSRAGIHVIIYSYSCKLLNTWYYMFKSRGEGFFRFRSERSRPTDDGTAATAVASQLWR